MCEEGYGFCRYICETLNDAVRYPFSPDCDEIRLVLDEGEGIQWTQVPSRVREIAVRFYFEHTGGPPALYS